MALITINNEWRKELQEGGIRKKDDRNEDIKKTILEIKQRDVETQGNSEGTEKRRQEENE